MRSDIEIHDRDGKLTALVEVKGRPGTDATWAAALRRNLASHGLLRPAKYFVVATPDRFYFWVDKTTDPQLLPPDFSFEPEEALGPYFEKAGISRDRLSGTGLELIIAAWLRELLREAAAARLPPDAEDWLSDAGFLHAIERGRLQLE